MLARQNELDFFENNVSHMGKQEEHFVVMIEIVGIGIAVIGIAVIENRRSKEIMVGKFECYHTSLPKMELTKSWKEKQLGMEAGKGHET